MQISKLQAYVVGMIAVWIADSPCLGGCSLNIDNLGAKGLKTNDAGNTDAVFKPGLRVAGFDGVVFRVLI